MFADLEKAEAAKFYRSVGTLAGCSSKSNRSFQVRQLTSAIWSGERCDEGRKQDDSRQARLPSQGRHWRGRRRAAAAAPLASARADTESTDEKRKARYQETDHIKSTTASTAIRAEGGRPC